MVENSSEEFDIKTEVIDWLMEGDPSIQWQTAKDILSLDNDEIHQYRLHVELDGWGNSLLAMLGDDQKWTSSMLYPKWKGNIWVLLQLRQFGIYPLDHLRNSASHLLSLIDFDGGIIDQKTGQTHSCLSGISLGLLSYFRVSDKKRSALLEYIVEHQKDDGSWLCTDDEDPLETTYSVLLGLRDHLMIDQKNSSIIKDMQREAHEFLLKHHLFKHPEKKTIIDLDYFKFPFPFKRYDVLTILDYFRSIGFKYDSRLKDAVEVVASKGINYKWILNSNKFEPLIQIDEDGKNSRWNTMRALRVLKWWNKISKEEIDVIKTE